METKTEYNRLIDEKSPYLKQHAGNPVDWYPWGKEAFEKAEAEDKLIFLSIGYSTCHWCHVMAEESFEDKKAADLINEHFVAVKVDREERPDIDSIYMKACQMMNGRGGWPLTVFMTYEKKPFFTATYIPKNSYGGRTGLMDLIPRIAELWQKEKIKVVESADRITGILQGEKEERSGFSDLNLNIYDMNKKTNNDIYKQLKLDFDEKYGGFGSSPKFPMSHRILFLCRYYQKNKSDEALKMIEKTLKAWRCGGIYDQLGFGFHRYATDEKWLLPHFEKMLYDQALLIRCYLAFYQLTGNEKYAQVVDKISEYIQRDMLSEEGGFYSAEDADSEGVEGKFYLWKKEEIEEHLGFNKAKIFIEMFNVKARGNYREESTGEYNQNNILHVMDIESIGSLEDSRQKLFEVREKRVHPHKDEKILTDWNGLMITALARAANILDNDRYLSLAEKAVLFINKKMFDSKGRLLHRYKDDEAAIRAYLDDYAFLIQGLIELYQTVFNTEYLRLAVDLQDKLNEHFWDNKNGGFYFTADDSERILMRDKPLYDGAVPSGNSISLWNLIRLFHITGDVQYREQIEKMNRYSAGKIVDTPAAYLQYVNSYSDFVDSFYSIVVVGRKDAAEIKEIKKALRKHYLPNKVLMFKDVEIENAQESIDNISSYTESFDMKDGKTTIYFCNNQNCELPTTEVDEMIEMLKV